MNNSTDAAASALAAVFIIVLMTMVVTLFFLIPSPSMQAEVEGKQPSKDDYIGMRQSLTSGKIGIDVGIGQIDMDGTFDSGPGMGF